MAAFALTRFSARCPMRRLLTITLLVVSALGCFAATASAQSTLKSATSSFEVDIQKNVAYLPEGRAEKADLYLPKGRAAGVRSPAVVIIHGGGWSGGKRDAAREINIGTTLAQHGYVGLSIDYLLSTETQPSWPQNLHDCKTAVRWLRANAERLQIDVDRIGVIGGSAGGHLSALVALTGEKDGLDPAAPYGEYSCAVQCCIDMYGATEFADGKGARWLLGADKSADEKNRRVAYLTTYIDAKDPPFLILHGTADELVPVAQSEMLAAALQKVGVEHELLIIEGAPHSFHLQPAQKDLRPVVLAFFDKHLSPRSSKPRSP